MLGENYKYETFRDYGSTFNIPTFAQVTKGNAHRLEFVLLLKCCDDKGLRKRYTKSHRKPKSKIFTKINAQSILKPKYSLKNYIFVILLKWISKAKQNNARLFYCCSVFCKVTMVCFPFKKAIV